MSQASWEPVFAALRAELMVPTNKLQRKAVKQQFKFINQEVCR